MFEKLKNDIPAGIVVFLVAVPLCLGISLASGAPFFSGLISGIIGGIVVGMLSSSKLSVSGPAAGLAALVLSAIHNIGDFRLFLCAVIIAGLLQVIFSIAKLAGIANYFPSGVIKGMLTSIGILIIAKQIPHALGYDKDEQGHLTELMPFGDMHEIFQPIQHIDVGVLLLCLLSIAIMLLWERPFIKNRVKFFPGALAAVIVSVITNEVLIRTNSAYMVSNDHLVTLPIAQSVSDFFGFFTLPDLHGFTNIKVIITGVMIAIIASLETLLSIEAVDNIDPERNISNVNRELMAQGIGNTIAGFIGGLPITSVIVRSSANINAGGKSKFAAILHGVLMLFFILLIPGVLNKIPLSALAAILLLTGYKLSSVKFFKAVYQNGKYQLVPFVVTVVTTLSIDLFVLFPVVKGYGLLIGVFVGLLSALGGVLHGNLKNSHYFHLNKNQNNVIVMRLAQEVSFLNKASIRQTLDHLPPDSHVLIDASDTAFIDIDVLDIIREFKDIRSPIKNIKCELVGFKEIYNIEKSEEVI